MSLIIAGHRGVAGTHPENTLCSIEEANRIGLSWIEVDIQPTRDGILVVCHDHTVERCSNGHGRVDELTLSELQQFDFGSWKDPLFSGERILTLDELLTYCHNNTLHINLEVKVDTHDAQYVVRLLAEALYKSPIDRNLLLISSFNREVMLALHSAQIGAKLGVLGRRLNQKVLQTIRDIDAYSCHLNYRWLTKRHIYRLREQDVKIWCYTVNNPKSFRHLTEVDAVFSDYPQRFMDCA